MATQPLDFSSQAVAPAQAAPLDFSSQAVAPASGALDFSSQAHAPATSSSPLAALRNSAGSLVSGLGHLGTVVDQGIQNNAPAWLSKGLGATGDIQNGGDQAVVNAGQGIAGNTQYKPAPLTSVSDIAKDAVGLAAQAAPYAATTLTGPAAPVIMSASAAGNTLNDRMTAKGESSPSAGDIAAATGDAALNAVGGRAAAGVSKIPGVRALASDAGSAITRALGRVATNALAGGAVGAGNYVAQTAGTGNMTGQAALSAAGQGAAAGGLMTPVADAAGVPAALRTALAERSAASLHPEQAASIERVAGDIASRVQAAKASSNSVSASDAAASLGSQLQGELNAHVSRLTQSGALSPSDKQAVIAPLMQQAKAGTLHPSDSAVASSPLSQFDAMELAPNDKAALRNGLIDLSTATRDGAPGGLLKPVVDHVVNSSTAKAVETLGGTALGYMHGGDVGAALGGLAGAALPKTAASIAGGVDSLLGANVPAVVRQRVLAQRALQQAGTIAGGSSLDALQAARQANSGGAANDSGPTPEQIGQQAAAQRQASMLARFGAQHPVGNAAMTALASGGKTDLINQAVAQFQANQPIRDAAAAGRAYDVAGQHQGNLDAANATPGGSVGINAINAAANGLGRRAQATMRLAGSNAESGNPPGAAQAASGTPGASSNVSPPSESVGASSGLIMGLADYLSHQALWSQAGTSLTPAELQRGLTDAAVAGKLAPDQYETLQDHIAQNSPLHHVGGAANEAMNAVVQHAVAAKIGGDVSTSNVMPGGTNGGKGGGSNRGDTPSIYSPTRYGNAVATNQATLEHIATHDPDQGVRDTATALRTTKNVGARQAVVDAAVRAKLPHDPVGAARIKTLFGPDLIQAGEKTK